MTIGMNFEITRNERVTVERIDSRLDLFFGGLTFIKHGKMCVELYDYRTLTQFDSHEKYITIENLLKKPNLRITIIDKYCDVKYKIETE
jgi:hypothetical protein